MKSMTMAEYGEDPFIKPLVLMESKEGKTTFEFMSLLGLWPWQQHGGVVSDPAHLHFVALDTAAMDRIFPRNPPDGRSILELAGVPMKTIEYVRSRLDVIKMDEEIKAAIESTSSYNHGWFKGMKLLRQHLIGKMNDPKETHAVVMSSFTSMCKYHERCLFGDPTGQGGDTNAYGTQNLWTVLKAQLLDVRVLFHAMPCHMFWEGHVSKQKKGNKDEYEDTLSIHGGAKDDWPKNTSHNFRVVRETVKWKGKDGKPTGVDQMYINPKPSYSFIPSGGRGVGGLAEKEYDLTKMMMDMGYQVGGWKP
jgi:hypothetical protein